MRILVTGATGFVGRWLVQELQAHGHDAIGAPGSGQLDITDSAAVAELVRRVRPHAIAHLAGMSFAGDAARDPERAVAVNVGGTRAIIEAAAAVDRIPILVSGSSEVYGTPDPNDVPLGEDAPLRASQPYGRSKLEQERVALDIAAFTGVPLVVTRSFNHTGPGQRSDFVAPALAARLLHARTTGQQTIPVGNLDVRRDVGDVRDVVRAYRLLLEGLVAGAVPPATVVNVGTGRAVSIREILDTLADAVGIVITPRVEPDLVRPNDPALIVADVSRVRELTGWTAEIPLRTTLRDLVRSLEGAL